MLLETHAVYSCRFHFRASPGQTATRRSSRGGKCSHLWTFCDPLSRVRGAATIKHQHCGVKCSSQVSVTRMGAFREMWTSYSKAACRLQGLCSLLPPSWPSGVPMNRKLDQTRRCSTLSRRRTSACSHAPSAPSPALGEHKGGNGGGRCPGFSLLLLQEEHQT